jgi:iron complex outermembrane receptor protein
MDTILNKRDTQSSAFYRTPSDTRVEYPDGFLPMMESQILDYSGTLGIKGSFIHNWQWSLSNTYGYNSFDYNSKDTMNYDLDPNSPTSFHLGKLIFMQNSTNFDLKKKLNNFTIAGGMEYRYENYQIKAGDPASYFESGAQGYMGYKPEQEVDASRNNYALYLDTSYKNYKNINTQVALRYEDYSDFGSTEDIKLSFEYKPLKKLLLRTTISTGFRAPSLAQSNFSHTSSALTNNVLLQKGIFTVNHPVSQSLGAKELKPELSKHLTVGGVYQFTNKSSLMIDAFYIRVDDKIIISDKLAPTTQEQYNIFTEYGVSTASYLTNAINTKTLGIDIKFNNNYTFKGGSTLNSTLWYNYSKNEIIDFNEPLSAGRVLIIEKGQPEHNIKFSNNYKRGKFDYLLNVNGYSKFYQSIGDTAYKFSAIATVDLNINYKINKAFDIALGGDNIFDAMPDKWDRSNIYLGYDGIIPYPSNSPVGPNGAYYYLNAKWKF